MTQRYLLSKHPVLTVHIAYNAGLRVVHVGLGLEKRDRLYVQSIPYTHMYILIYASRLSAVISAQGGNNEQECTPTFLGTFLGSFYYSATMYLMKSFSDSVGSNEHIELAGFSPVLPMWKLAYKRLVHTEGRGQSFSRKEERLSGMMET